MNYILIHSDELYHYGVPGQKRGIRRYQNPDGSLTAAGRERYGRSLKGSFHRGLSRVYASNERYYKKRAAKLEAKGRNAKYQKQVADANRVYKDVFSRKAEKDAEAARKKRMAKAQKRMNKAYNRPVSSLKK